MVTKTMKYVELLSLDAELNGFYREAQKDENGNQVQPEIKIVGILNSLPVEIGFILKYRLDKFAQAVAAAKKEFVDMQIELAKKYGEETENGVSIETEIKGKPNPKFAKFSEENEALLQEEFDLTYKPLPLKEMGTIVNGQRYSILYDFIED